MDLRCGHSLVKMYAKTKELGAIGGRAPGTPPPRSANAVVFSAVLSLILSMQTFIQRLPVL